jgi:hypothetical protein
MEPVDEERDVWISGFVRQAAGLKENTRAMRSNHVAGMGLGDQ